MRRAFRTSSHPTPEVNLTPLIDVVFVILIMFIVIAPLLELDRVTLAEGSAQEARSLQESSQIVLHVLDDNTVKLRGKEIPLEKLLTYLSLEKEKHPSASPQLYQDEKSTFGVYQKVKQATLEAGFTHLDVILKPK